MPLRRLLESMGAIADLIAGETGPSTPPPIPFVAPGPTQTERRHAQRVERARACARVLALVALYDRRLTSDELRVLRANLRALSDRASVDLGLDAILDDASVIREALESDVEIAEAVRKELTRSGLDVREARALRSSVRALLELERPAGEPVESYRHAATHSVFDARVRLYENAIDAALAEFGSSDRDESVPTDPAQRSDDGG